MDYMLGVIFIYSIVNSFVTFRIYDQLLEVRLQVVRNEANWTCNCECDDEFEDDGPDEPEREPAPVLKFVRN